jgi:hypothetical protein
MTADEDDVLKKKESDSDEFAEPVALEDEDILGKGEDGIVDLGLDDLADEEDPWDDAEEEELPFGVSEVKPEEFGEEVADW